MKRLGYSSHCKFFRTTEWSSLSFSISGVVSKTLQRLEGPAMRLQDRRFGRTSQR